MNVLLWPGADLDYALRNGKMLAGLNQKLRDANEMGIAMSHLGKRTP